MDGKNRRPRGGQPLPPDHKAGIIRSYLRDANQRGLISSDNTATLLRDVEQLLGPPSTQPPPPLTPSPPPTSRGSGPAPQRSHSPPAASPTTIGPLSVEPGLVVRWWQRAQAGVRGDLALHGLAYLGVLMVFAGLTGFILFSFSEIEPGARVLTELAAPTLLLGAGWYLSSRGAEVAANALVVVGGAALSFVMVASLSDGVAIPPDPGDRLLPVAQALVLGVLVTLAALGVQRHQWLAPLAWLAGPVLWIGAGLLAAATLDSTPNGLDIVLLRPIQLSVAALAVTATVALIKFKNLTGPTAQRSLLTALPAGLFLLVAELLAATNDHWAPAAALIGAVAALGLLELAVSPPPRLRLGVASARSAQIVVIAATGLRLSAAWDFSWVIAATIVVLIAAVEYQGHRQPNRIAALVGLGAIGLGLLVVAGEPIPAWLASTMVTLWALYRRVERPAWAPLVDRWGFTVAGPATVAAANTSQAFTGDPTVLAISVALLIMAVIGRLRADVGSDQLWRWFLPTASGGFTLWAAGPLLNNPQLNIPLPNSPQRSEPLIFSVLEAHDGTRAAGLALVALALSLSVLAPGLRVWAVAGVSASSLGALALALNLGLQTQAVWSSILALTLVAIALRWPTAVSHHVAFVGYGVGVAAPLWSGYLGGPTTAAVALLGTGLAATVVVNERGFAAPMAWLRASGGADNNQNGADNNQNKGWIDSGLVIATMAIWAATAPLVFDSVLFGGEPIIPIGSRWSPIVSAAAALASSLAIRLVGWRRAKRSVMVYGPMAISALSSVLVAARSVDNVNWALTTSMGLGVATVFALPPSRPQLAWWGAWLQSGILAPLAANQLGLEWRWTPSVVATWGAVVVIAPLAWVRFRGRPPIYPAVILGSVGLAGGGIGALLVAVSSREFGWVALGLAVAVLAISLLDRRVELGGLSQALAFAAYAGLAPWDPLDRPWTIASAATATVGLAGYIGSRSRSSYGRHWAKTTLIVGIGATVAATVLASDDQSRFVTYLIVGVLWYAIAVAAKVWPLGTAATALLVVTWFQLTRWQSWSDAGVFYGTVPLGALVGWAAALVVRQKKTSLPLGLGWVVAGASLVAFPAPLLGYPSLSGGTGVGRLGGGLTLAAAILVLAIAAGTLAQPFHRFMRLVGVIVAGLAWWPAMWGLELSPASVVVTGSLAAIGVAIGAAIARSWRPDGLWAGPALGFAGLTQLGPMTYGIVQSPQRDLLVIGLASITVELIASAVVAGRRELFVAAPATGAAAWLVYASGALAGEANWFTVPIGFALLVMVSLTRWIQSQRDQPTSGFNIVGLELLGMGLMVGAALIQTVTGDLWKALIAVGFAVAITGWGIVTKVAWRAQFGATTAFLAVVLLVAVPAANLDVWTGPSLWITVTLLGLAAVAVAASIERGRRRLHQAVNSMNELTKDWEHPLSAVSK